MKRPLTRKRTAATERRALEPERATSGTIRTLAIDVGGSHLKAAVVDETGHLITAPVRVDTPVGSQPDAIVGTLVKLVEPLGAYDRVSVGFPGVVRAGRILTAPNLGNGRAALWNLKEATR
jgi:polyphosphate glucokinase